MTGVPLSKFRKINKHLLESLVHSEIYFARPDRLNDPFDCRVDIAKAFEITGSRLHVKRLPLLEMILSADDFFQDVNAKLATTGVCSFSLELDNPLMWSHYADEHRGLCLTYIFPQSFVDDPANQIHGIEKVVYGDNLLTDWLVQRVPGFGLYEDFFPSMIMKVLAIKAKKWEHENEVRILRFTEGALALDKRFLKQVVFGLRTPESDISLVRDLLANFGYDVVYGRVVRGLGSDFGIDVEEI